MAENEFSLSAIKALPSVKMALTQNGIETMLCKENEVFSIMIDDIVLRYDPVQIVKKPEQYFLEQSQVHERYLAQFDIFLDKAYQSAAQVLASESDFHRRLQFISEGKQNSHMGVAKMLISPLYWLKGTTFRGHVRKNIDSLILQRSTNMLLRDVIIEGKQMFENYAVDNKLSEHKYLESCLTHIRDIVFVYERLVAANHRETDSILRFYKLLYPKDNYFNEKWTG